MEYRDFMRTWELISVITNATVFCITKVIKIIG